MNRIYADHAATTPMLPEVTAVMVDVMEKTYGNPSSIHQTGRAARKILDDARTLIASMLGVHFNEIHFTSGGTEADNLAIFGTADAMQHKGKHIITTAVEHHAVLHPCQELEKRGFEVTYLEVDKTGRISMEELASSLREDTILVTVMYGNNESGTIQPIKEIGECLKDHQAVFHTDAVQAFGLSDIRVRDEGIDLLSVSSHKINGPKGAGFLYIKNGTPHHATVFGGEQERKKRAGTENLAAISGFAEAVKHAYERKEEKTAELVKIKETLIHELKQSDVPFEVNGSLEYSLPHVVNLSIPGAEIESLLINLDLAGIAASSGSACTAGSVEPSHVLAAMFGSESEKLFNSVRFSFGYGNTVEDAVYIAQSLKKMTDRF
ncbi:cysteine desulfurase family protein [Jeotgalibacillus haloalkalitolerans]|uniref:cysteine desulfurase n=1 Tax=Jeotgalibacillus haloalkalitolerans TaxID=3104292 RepID=A0ABU5KMZ5_9BACL|nr:cysteine desulfurase family protein [Jeotgalibacillus sp. HH7-29]MDZ5712316.1 cysteine desulfurase family protein [Jeotgalibacillus sp. HH7-29]